MLCVGYVVDCYCEGVFVVVVVCCVDCVVVGLVGEEGEGFGCVGVYCLNYVVVWCEYGYDGVEVVDVVGG